MNCEHQESGWCLECVGKLHDELTQLQDVAIKAFYCIAATRVMQPTETIQAKYSFTNPTDANGKKGKNHLGNTDYGEKQCLVGSNDFLPKTTQSGR